MALKLLTPVRFGKRERFYLCCHPKDLEAYGNEILDLLCSYSDFDIYCFDALKSFDEEEHFFELKQMQLFVIPVTFEFLNSKNYAFDVELNFALKNHIPILPIVYSEDLIGLFNKKCGNLHAVIRKSNIEEKSMLEKDVQKYLSQVVIDQELVKRIREEFNGHIFLSYRRVDKMYAGEMLTKIHHHDSCRDLAVWYDDFLVPGEDFNEEIESNIQSSDLFMLLVTPNLIKPSINGGPNYIVEYEYPYAKEKYKKTIFPVEFAHTDSEELSKKFNGIPYCINAYDDEAFFTSLTNVMDKADICRRDDTSEHNYLIGLAYLKGIDVEINYERALQLLTLAANEEHDASIELLAEMYDKGMGVKADDDKKTFWREKLVLVRKQKYDKEPTLDNVHKYVISLIRFSECLISNGKKESLIKARKVLEYATEINNAQNTNGINLTELENYVIIYFDLALANKNINELSEAEEAAHKSINFALTIIELAGSINWNHHLVTGYLLLGDIVRDKTNLKEALVYYNNAVIYSESIGESGNTAESRRLLGVCLTRRGDVLLRGADELLPVALEDFKNAINVFESIPGDHNTILMRRDLSVCYEKLGSAHTRLGNIEESTAALEKKLQIDKDLCAETNDINDLRSLAIAYEKISVAFKTQKEYKKAEEALLECLSIRETILKEHPMSPIKYELFVALYFLAILFNETNDIQRASQYYEKAIISAYELHTLYSEMTKYKEALSEAVDAYSEFINQHSLKIPEEIDGIMRINLKNHFEEETAIDHEDIIDSANSHIKISVSTVNLYIDMGNEALSRSVIEDAVGYYVEAEKTAANLLSANKVSDELEEAHKKAVNSIFNLFMRILEFGDECKNKGDTQGAEANYKAAVSVSEYRAEKIPGPNSIECVALSYLKLSELETENRNEYADRAVLCYKFLCENEPDNEFYAEKLRYAMSLLG